ncbi:MAG: 3-deoxy-manno-octulosonate cytidylyltransferase, partial [Gemmatimonadota bacterium]|nr:3-deoxy-manno-octulosonate cytidylyltransferase [Gemmatimonadota bacterium]
MKLYDDWEVGPEVAEAAGRVEMIVMDVDGVLTDGSIYMLASGEQIIRFNVQDAMGLALCGKAGIKLAVISGRDVPAVRTRLESLPKCISVIGRLS